jgi:nitrate reductase NapE component
MKQNSFRVFFLFFIILAIFFLQSVAIAENEENTPNLRVDGIMYDKDDPIAVVNDQVVRKGESIEGARIIEITDIEVTFQYNDKTLVRSVGEGQSNESAPKQYYKKAKLALPDISSIKNIRSREEAGKVIADYVIKFWPILLAIFVAAYTYMSAMVHIIANKTGTGHGWMAWIPIVNIFLLCMIAEKSFLWVLLFLIPFGQLIFIVGIWGGIAESCGKSWWLGVLAVLPGLNFIVAGYLAFSKISD